LTLTITNHDLVSNLNKEYWPVFIPILHGFNFMDLTSWFGEKGSVRLGLGRYKRTPPPKIDGGA
jgi:hypothetical protein